MSRGVRMQGGGLPLGTHPWWWPFTRSAPMAVWGRVWLPRGLRERLSRTDPERLGDIIEHETIHVARQHARGMALWHLRYVLSRRFRWDEEKAAYHASLTRLRQRGGTLAPHERAMLARLLAGPRYGFMTRRPAARAFIDAVLDG
jgi:hypothetical protein